MDNNSLIVGLIGGAVIPMIGNYINNLFLIKNSNLKYENDRKLELEKLQFDNKKNIRLEKNKAIKEIAKLISQFENSISLTSSVIESSSKLNLNDFDLKYKNELQFMIKLKSLIVCYFPELFEEIIMLDSIYNQYWGNQRLLLLLNPKTDFEKFNGMTSEIIKVEKKASLKIDSIMNRLLDITNELNKT